MRTILSQNARARLCSQFHQSHDKGSQRSQIPWTLGNNKSIRHAARYQNNQSHKVIQKKTVSILVDDNCFIHYSSIIDDVTECEELGVRENEEVNKILNYKALLF